MRDELLVERLKRSPEQGMKQLIDKYGGTVRALVKGRLMPQSFSEADIDECTADTFSDFYLSLDRCDLSKGSVKAYLCVIARNKAADRLRSYYRNLSVVPLEENDAVFELDLEDKEMTQIAETVIGKLESISDSEYDEFAFEDNYAD